MAAVVASRKNNTDSPSQEGNLEEGPSLRHQASSHSNEKQMTLSAMNSMIGEISKARPTRQAQFGKNSPPIPIAPHKNSPWAAYLGQVWGSLGYVASHQKKRLRILVDWVILREVPYLLGGPSSPMSRGRSARQVPSERHIV